MLRGNYLVEINLISLSLVKVNLVPMKNVYYNVKYRRDLASEADQFEWHYITIYGQSYYTLKLIFL